MFLKRIFKSLNAKTAIVINRVFLITAIIIIAIVIMFITKSFDMEYFRCEEYKSIQFNLLTVNSILIGFLFTFLGIFITASESESLKENRAYAKFGVMVWSIVIGLVAVALSLLINIVVIILNYELFMKFSEILIATEISLMLVGVGLFLSTTYDSIFLMKMIRSRHLKFEKKQVNAFTKSINKKK